MFNLQLVLSKAERQKNHVQNILSFVRCLISVIFIVYFLPRTSERSHIFKYIQYTEGYKRVMSECKAVPLQAWSGSECSRKLRFPEFMTTAQDGGKVVSLTHRPPLPPENTLGIHFC